MLGFAVLPFGSQIGRYLVFAILLIAGIAKLSTVVLDGADNPTRLMSVFQGLVEIYLGVFYVSFWFPSLMRKVLLGVLLAFLAYNGYLIWQGATSCGCFGSVSVAPFYMAMLNVGLFVIVFFIPSKVKETFQISPMGLGVLTSSTLIALAVLISPISISNVRDSIVIAPSFIELDYGFDGYERQVPMVLKNVSSKPIRITGWDTNSNSAKLLDFKKGVLAAGESQTYQLQLSMAPFNEEKRHELISGLAEYRSRKELTDLKQIRVIRFLNQFGEDCAKCVIQENLTESVIESVLDNH